MANKESTAVNELLERLAQQQQTEEEPAEDLMFSPPQPPPPPVPTKKPATRVTATVPPVRGAGEVAPLPRSRSPMGTQQGMSAGPPPVRVSTAPPSRSVTIPPLPGAADTMKDLDPTFGEPAPTMKGLGPPLGDDPPGATSTKRALPPPVRPSHSRSSRTSVPPPAMPVAAPFEERRSNPFEPEPSSHSNPEALPDIHIEVASNAEWFEPSHAIEPAKESVIGTARVPRAHDWKTIAGKLVAPMIILVIVGIFIGGYVAFDGDGGKRRNAATSSDAKIAMTALAAVGAPTAAANEPAKPEPANVAPAKVEPPNIEPRSTTAPPLAAPATGKIIPTPAPAIVDVLIESNPVGATVMLVDRGKTTFLGTTPLSAGVDPGRRYDLVFAYPNRPTQLEPLDPTTTKRVSVTFGRAGKSRPSDAEIEPPKVGEVPSAAPVAAVVAPNVEAPKRERSRDKSSTEATSEHTVAQPAGAGTLMISSKPPCEIIIDGKPTGLSTPQRSIPLPAGSHKVTLVNTAEGIKKTIAVQIAADKPTKVIQDLMMK